MSKIKLGVAALLLLASMPAYGQGGWSLRRCIDYAIENNISVQRSAIAADQQEVALNTARNSRLPSLGANMSGNLSFGRGQDRTGVYKDNTQASTSIGASVGVPVFAGFRINHEIAGNRLDLEASLQDLARARDDVALNITSLYLQVLFNKEILRVAQAQVEISRGQLQRSEIMFREGKSPESVVYDAKSVLAKDEMNLTQAGNNLTLSRLTLVHALNLREYEGFDIEDPAAEQLLAYALKPVPAPDDVYGYASLTRPAVLAENLRLDRSRTSLRLARSSYYPQISMSAGYGNGYYYSFMDGAVNTSFSEQFRKNGSESVGLSMSIPIFSRFAVRNNVRTAKLQISSQELALEQVKQTLRKEIEQAYYDAQAARKKYESASEAMNAAREAFRYEEIRMSVDGSTLYEFNDAKTRLERAESDMIQSKYEFVFKRKVLDFYSGIPLAL